MKHTAFAALFLLAGCVSSHHESTYTHSMRLIEDAAEAAPDKVEGEFIFHINATGSQHKYVYLNTELDYRDQRNITIAIPPEVVQQLENQLGKSPQEHFLNKTVMVTGLAERVTIAFISNGQLTDKYYYQTHVLVAAPDQIKVLK